MTINDQNKLLELQANGHAIKIDIGPYVDGFARIYRREDGKVVFDSRVYSDVELDNVWVENVSVYKVMDDWQKVSE